MSKSVKRFARQQTPNASKTQGRDLAADQKQEKELKEEALKAGRKMKEAGVKHSPEKSQHSEVVKRYGHQRYLDQQKTQDKDHTK